MVVMVGRARSPPASRPLSLRAWPAREEAWQKYAALFWLQCNENVRFDSCCTFFFYIVGREINKIL